MIPLHELGQLRISTECCIVFKNQVLIQKRPSDSKFFPNYLTFPGGHVDAGEDILNCVVREVLEETGISLNKENTFLRVSAINYHIDRKQVWAAFGFYSEINELIEPKYGDEGEVLWMRIEDVKKSKEIFPPIKYYVDHIFNSNKILYMSSECEGGFIKRVTSEFKI